MKDSKNKMLTAAQIALMFGVTTATIRLWSRNGLLESQATLGGHRRYRRTVVEHFAKEKGIELEAEEKKHNRILVIDDDVNFNNFLVDYLKSVVETIEVKSALSGFGAGILVRDFKPSIILLDLMMPGLDGLSICELLKSSKATSGIKVIAMTGFPSEESRERILGAGAQAYLEKPLELSVLAKLCFQEEALLNGDLEI